MSRLNILALLVAGGFMLFSFFGQADRDDAGQVVSEGSLDVFSLRVGDCTNDAEEDEDDESDEVTSVAAVPCEQLHDNEFYASFDLTDETFPGDEAVEEAADETCLAKFDPFVGLEYAESVLVYSYLYPTAESWADGDREILCMLYHGDFDKLKGSMSRKKI